jgi:hypothetical protein
MRRLLSGVCALALVLGCTEKPSEQGQGAEAQPGDAPAAVEVAPGAASAVPGATKIERVERRRSEPGLKMPDTIVTISARPVGEVFDAALAMADAVKPGVSVLARMGLFAGADLPPDIFTKVATGKPMRVYIFNPKGQSGTLAMVFGDGGEGGMSFLVDTISSKAGVQAKKDGGTATFEFGGDTLVITRAAPWIVLGNKAQTVAAIVAGLKNSQPTYPDGEDHIAVDVDIAAIRTAFGKEISQGMMMARAGIGGMAAQQGEMMARLLQEYMNMLEGMLQEADAIEFSFRFLQTSFDVMTTITPARGSTIETLATKQKACSWKHARVLPSGAMLAAAWSIQPEVAENLMDILGGVVARVALGASPEPAQIEKYKSLLRPFLSIVEGASGATIGKALNVTYATSADRAAMRRIYKESMPELNAGISGFLSSMGVEMVYAYKENVRQLDGKPVDAVETTTRATNEIGQNQLAMTKALWGGETQVVEFTEAAGGTVFAMGEERTEALAAAKAAMSGPDHEGFGWANASKGLQEALAMAPEKTWAAYEMKIGAYTAFILKAFSTAQPMVGGMIPDASELDAGDGDLPMVGWMASDDGRIVSFNRLPTATVATIEKYIEKVVAAFRGGMGPGGPITPAPDDDADLF